MTNDEAPGHLYRMCADASYRAGYRSGLVGTTTPRNISAHLEPVGWAHGWRAGVNEAATAELQAPVDVTSTPKHDRLTSDRVAVRVENRWVVARYGVQQSQFLSLTRIWGAIADAAWFIDRAAAHAALCPPGTTGIAMQMAAKAS